MTLLLHGESGTGKSWLADTAPGPRLILDIEGRAKHTPSGPKLWWDPLTQAPPAPPENGNWDTCVVDVKNFSLLSRVYAVLRSGEHPFKSVVIDSLMEAQKRWMDDHIGKEQMRTQDWGSVLRDLEKFVRDMRDIVTYDESHVDVVVVVTGSAPDDRSKQRPMLQGQLKNTLPYFLDSVGYLYMAPLEGGGQQRVLQVQPDAFAVAKDGTGKLGGPLIGDPNLTTLYNQL